MMLSGQGDAANQPVFMQPVIAMPQQVPQQPDHSHQWRQPSNQSQEFQIGGGWGQDRSLTPHGRPGTVTGSDGGSEGGCGNQWPPEGHGGHQWQQPPNQGQEFQMGANYRGGGWGQETSQMPHSGAGTGTDSEWGSEGGSGNQWRQPPNQSQEFQMGANHRGGGWGQERPLLPYSGAGTGTASDGSSEGGSSNQWLPEGHRGSSDELWLEGSERV